MDIEKVVLYGDPLADVMVLQMISPDPGERMREETEALRVLCPKRKWCVAAVPADSWKRDLTRWPSQAVFGGEAFGGSAKTTLDFLLETLIPKLEKEYPRAYRDYMICGYSLAGLFALWAAYQTDRFSAAAAVSPSLWYPGWIDYASGHIMQSSSVYLSLGVKEEKTRNKVMASVGDCVRKQYDILKNQGVSTELEWNPGNHFFQSGLRTAKGIAWLLNNR